MSASLPAGVRCDLPLAPLTTLGVGGNARFFAGFSGPRRLRELLGWAADEGLDVCVLGGGSNVVVADRGIDGLVLHPTQTSVSWRDVGDRVVVTAGAGLGWDGLVAASVARGLAGLECLSGIPGLCGAAPVQNIGAYGQEVGALLLGVTVLDRREGSLRRWEVAECDFGYRDSMLKRAGERYVVLDITLGLRRDGMSSIAYPDLLHGVGAGASPARVREAVLELRRGKGMVVESADPDSRSAGSFFVNPVVAPGRVESVARFFEGDRMPRWEVAGGVKLSAAWLIEHCGMPKGWDDTACGGVGRVGLSRKHALALVNRGGATAAEVLAFAEQVRGRVLDRCGVTLEREPRLLG